MKPLDEWTDEELVAYFGGDIFPVPDTDIAWELEPPFRLEDFDLNELNAEEALRVLFLFRDALRDMRELVHVAVEQLAILTRECDRLKRRRPEARARAFRPSPPDHFSSGAANEQNDSR